ncbi:HotDog domain-containing protein [Sporodiniella umbellata]|nr:HotDog domain-containing protein [Sporodiniella umbellata]
MDGSKAIILAAVPIGILALSHIKSFPLVYTFRSWLTVRSVIKKTKKNKLRPEPLFTTISQDHRCYLDDIDYNQHMNNGMYNKMLDFSRIELLYSIFPKVCIVQDLHIFGHTGGVVTLFRKEIPPFAKYRVQGRLYAWNNKWFVIQHRFVLDDGTVACYALSKIVFKKLSGKSIPPEQILEICGHNVNDKEIIERNAHNWETAQHILCLDKATEDPYPWTSKL